MGLQFAAGDAAVAEAEDGFQEAGGVAFGDEPELGRRSLAVLLELFEQLHGALEAGGLVGAFHTSWIAEPRVGVTESPYPDA